MSDILFNTIGLLLIFLCYTLFGFEVTSLVILFMIYSEIKDD